jgi:outer membrane protein OmpA-like peptidoglycan-associated protein
VGKASLRVGVFWHDPRAVSFPTRAALSDPRLKGSIISIGGHTDAVGSDAFNQNLSERRAASIKWYLVDNFKLMPANLHSVGYGKRQPKNKADVFAPENRRVEIVNETLQAQH